MRYPVTTMKKLNKIIVGVLFVGFVLSLFISCSAESKSVLADPQYIEGHTLGEISRFDTIKVVFTKPLGSETGTVLLKSPLKLSPKISGQTVWLDEWTLEFKAAEPLPAGEKIHVEFNPSGSDFKQIPAFSFYVAVVPYEVSFMEGSLSVPVSNEASMMQYGFKVKSNDILSAEEIQKSVKAVLDKNDLEIVLDGEGSGTQFNFRIPDIKRAAEEQRLQIFIYTKENGKGKTDKEIRIPALGDFELLAIQPKAENDRYIELIFSDPVDENQDLTGLISSPEVPDLKIVQKTNKVKVFTTKQDWPSKFTIQVNDAVKNTIGNSLAARVSTAVNFPSKKPQVRFIGQGVIIPGSQGTTVPIETMNLNSVMVQAVKIYGSNIHQFMQVNKLNESKEIHRVGEVVWQRVIDLKWDEGNTDKWVRYGLDLSPLIKEDPEGMYQIIVTFRKSHIVYPCSGAQDEAIAFDSLNGPGEDQEADNSFWDYWEGSNNYNNYSFRRNRNDPCHDAYYVPYNDHNITKTRNVMISDIGIIAKRGVNENLNIYVSDINDATPKKGVSVKLFNYQKRLIGRGLTNSNGMLELSAKDENIFFIIAEKDNQFAYLRVDDGSAISISHFDTGGVLNEKGIQGFVYGERGVWRPGDTVHLTFILNDPFRLLPESHPVIFELYDPYGKQMQNRVLEQGVNGFYYTPVDISSDGVTGSWMAKFIVGGKTYSKSLSIETIMPNRLKIDLQFDSDNDYLSNGDISGTLISRWLHGAIASNLRSKITMNLSSIPTRFNSFKDYVFDDPAKKLSFYERTIFQGKLNSDGEVDFSSEVYVNEAPGMCKASFSTFVYEPGDSFSTEYRSIKYNPYSQYVGVKLPKGDVARGMLLTDVNHNVEIVLVDEDGDLVKSGSVTAELYEVNWRWWWESGADNLSSYTSRNSWRKISSGTVKIKNGKGVWKMRVNYPEWGRYIVRITDKKSGHSTGKIVYIDWPGWAGRAQEEGGDSASMIVMSVDKAKYSVGETAKIFIPSTADGRCLVTVENKGQIIKEEWIKTKKNGTSYKLKVTDSMTPNIYVHVTYLQKHLQTQNDRPLRSYGILSLSVENEETHLEPEIITSKVYEPGETIEIKIRESNGQPMTYTLAVVDEGLLGITSYHTPDPWKHFFRKQASMLKSWDIYNFVAGAYSGKLSTLLAIGGGGDGDDDDGGQKRGNRFKAVSIFEAPRTLKANGTNVHKIKLPQYIGEVRLMVVAGNSKGFGIEEHSVPVKKDLMVLSTLPRVLSPGEEYEIPVTVFSLNDKIKNVGLTVKVEGPASVKGSTYNIFKVSGAETARMFKLKVDESIGDVVITVTAKSGSHLAKEVTNLTIRKPSAPVTSIKDFTLKSGKSLNETIKLIGMPGSNEMYLEVSQIPPLDLGKRLQYLIRYPHGCIEQTTSSVFPQVYLHKVAQLTAEETDKIQDNVNKGIERLALFQTSSGGFAYWPGDSQANEWGSSYAGHFLLEAKNAGYFVSETMLAGLVAYQKNKANSWYGSGSGKTSNQIYRLFTLALAGESDLGAMNRARELNGLSNTDKWRLAMAYSLTGRKSEAKRLMKSAGTSVDNYVELSGTFGSSARDKAMILEAMILLGEGSKADKIAIEISKILTSTQSLNTQSISFSLIAMAKYGISETFKSLSIEYSWNGGKYIKVQAKKAIISELIKLDGGLSGKLRKKNKSGRTIYPRVILSGTPKPGQEKSESRSLNISVQYYSLDGRSLNVNNIPVGTDIKVKVTVKNTSSSKNYEELVLSHLVPSGWEIYNSRLSNSSSDSQFDYRDIRDDRVYTYFDLNRNKTKTFTLLANASYVGRFYLPLVTCEAMYDSGIYARTAGKWINIIESSTDSGR